MHEYFIVLPEYQEDDNTNQPIGTPCQRQVLPLEGAVPEIRR